MLKDLEYYLNHKNQCVTVPENISDYLAKHEYFSEFQTDEERLLALDNLGVTERLDILKQLIDNKVILQGALPWDLEPTQGNTDHILSSDALYNEFLKYATKGDIQTLYYALFDRVNELEESINTFTTNIEQDLGSHKEELQQIVSSYKSDLEYQIKTLKSFVENLYWHIYREVELKMFNPLLKNYEELSSYYKGTVEDLKQQFNSILKQNKDILPITNSFGDSEEIGVSQKTLTEALNIIYQQLAEINGYPDDLEIHISPDYVIGNEVIVNIECSTSKRIDYIHIYNHEELVDTIENVTSLNKSITLYGDCSIRVDALCLGRTYTKEKEIKCYNPTFLGFAQSSPDIIDTDCYVDTIEGTYNLHCNPNDKLYVITPLDKEYKLYMGGYEIPVNEELTAHYKIIESQNTYQEDTYEIRIELVE